MTSAPTVAGERLVVERPGLPSALADRIGFLLAHTHIGMRNAGNEALERFELDVREWAALALLDAEGGLSQQALAMLQRCDRTTMVAIVDRLEELGYAKRRRNPRDRRAYALEITPAGKRVLTEADGLLAEVERDFFAPLSAKERRTLIGLLQRLLVG
jgi:DNA-binding MarR family transcriptional regulator